MVQGSADGKGRQRALVTSSIILSVLGVLVVIYVRAARSPGSEQVAKRERPLPSHPKHEDALPRAEPQPKPTPEPARSKIAGWREVLQYRLSEIAKKLPDLSVVPPQTALMGRLRWGARTRTFRDGERLTAYEAYFPAALDERTYGPPGPWEDGSGFQLLSEILIDSELRPRIPGGASEVAAVLIDILELKDSALGDSADEAKVCTALRWMAAVGLRGLITDENRSRIEVIAASNRDEVLRGAVAGSLVAFRRSDDFLKNWLEREPSDRALQAFFVELGNWTLRSEYDDDANVVVQKETRDELEIDADKPARERRLPESGQDMGKHVLGLLNRLPRLRLPKGSDIDDADDRELRVAKVRGGGPQVPEAIADARTLATGSLYGRLKPEDLQECLKLLQEEPSARRRSNMVWAISSINSPEADQVLTVYATDPKAQWYERPMAMRGLALRSTEGATRVVEKLLWDPDEGVRLWAALALQEARSKVSSETKARLASLHDSATDDFDIRTYRQAASLVR